MQASDTRTHLHDMLCGENMTARDQSSRRLFLFSSLLFSSFVLSLLLHGARRVTSSYRTAQNFKSLMFNLEIMITNFQNEWTHIEI
eukprot:753046-Hanusia_phi.AAC.3